MPEVLQFISDCVDDEGQSFRSSCVPLLCEMHIFFASVCDSVCERERVDSVFHINTFRDCSVDFQHLFLSER